MVRFNPGRSNPVDYRRMPKIDPTQSTGSDLPIVTTRVSERWDCHSCGNCCTGLTAELNDDDLERLHEQKWEQHPDLRGKRITWRTGWFSRTRSLAHGPDGRCVFLTAENRCRIHEELGATAKPLVCRMYPLQLVPQAGTIRLSVQRNCPSAARDRGRDLTEHFDAAREYAALDEVKVDDPPPPICRGRKLPWVDAMRLLDAIEEVMLDTDHVIELRVARGLALCRLVESVDSGLPDLSAITEAEWPERPVDSVRPDKTTARLFRQSALKYLDLHPGIPTPAPRGRLRALGWAIRFVRGKGVVPEIFPGQPAATFESLEEPRQKPETQILRAIELFFTSHAASRRYAIVPQATWSIVDSFRRLSMSYAIAMWMVRLLQLENPEYQENAWEIVAMIDQAHGGELLEDWFHRDAVRDLARRGLDDLVFWYSR